MQSAPPQPVPLPPLQPGWRIESEIKSLSTQELAQWILPVEQAGQVVRAELIPQGMLPRLGGVGLFTAPRATLYPGLCEVSSWDVWFRVPNENSLTYQQHLDPPQQPYQYTRAVRWKVIGSTRREARSGPPDCAAALPYREWFDCPSAAAVYRAANLFEQAQVRPGSIRLTCTQMRYEEAKKDFGFPLCPNPRALLEQLTPNLIKRVRPADCTISPEPGERNCTGIEYHDPASPGSHSFYLVTMPDGPRPRYVQITQGMLPPH